MSYTGPFYHGGCDGEKMSRGGKIFFAIAFGIQIAMVLYAVLFLD